MPNEAELEEKCNRLIRTSAIIAALILITIILFLHKVYSNPSPRAYLNASEVGYYLRCFNDNDLCGNLGSCEKVTIVASYLNYTDSICLGK